jgi:hypothetical protein
MWNRRRNRSITGSSVVTSAVLPGHIDERVRRFPLDVFVAAEFFSSGARRNPQHRRSMLRSNGALRLKRPRPASASWLRFAAKAMVLSAASNDAAIKIAVRRIGPALVFERLWAETGCRAVIAELAGKRKHGLALERAVFLTVLHRLFVSGSDRAADRWREDYAIAGVAGLDLHHLYRAMAWLGEELPQKEQDGRTPFSPRCVKDVVEERLFAHRRDLLTRLDLVFMDTTSLYFEGAGGQTLGQHGYSKDHRPDLRQMILAVLIDGDGRPVCSETYAIGPQTRTIPNP